MLFAVPAIMLYTQSQSRQQPFRTDDLLHLWSQMGFFLAIFLIHNFLLAPLLLRRRRRALYFALTAAVVAVFAIVQCVSRPDKDNWPRHHDDRFEQRRGPWPSHDDAFAPARAPIDKPAFKHRRPHHRHGPMPLMEMHEVLAVIMLILMLGMNIGIKLYFRQKDDEQRLAELERENLEQQLEYLKYQINPHFLMNTLNNIHALVDIDPEQARETIVELSKIMRFVLYDGARSKVPLSSEIAFLENYIHLMRMRLADNVSVSVDLPDPIPDGQLPPLLLITFVENAFKHGVSYQQPSFVDMALSVEGSDGQRTLRFVCRNSKLAQHDAQTGGVGLPNAMRRLQLLYGDSYTLDIDDGNDAYSVRLSLPL